MNCPKCHNPLQGKNYKGIEVDACEKCEGMWLSLEELDQLEDTVFSQDELKGTTIFSAFPSKLTCAVCAKPMKSFKYRLYDLELDFCDNQHGFWLDNGEEKRVLQLMEQEQESLGRKFNREEAWTKTLRNLKSKDFISRLRDLFRS
ncbi:MAG: zf-TFIIB domain-containing protein [Candidatus Binatia bacterium]